MPTVPKDSDSDPGFSDWWGSDSTQEKFQGIMGAFTAVMGGLAGIPAGGGDMSSMERAAVRAAAAPGEARKRMRTRKFSRHIQSQLETETDPEKRMMLQGALANPQNAHAFLTADTPASKEARMMRVAEKEFGYAKQLEAIKSGNRASAKGELSAETMRKIGSANNWYTSLRKDQKDGLYKGEPVDVAFMDENAWDYLELLWSPEHGLLAQRLASDIASGKKGVENYGPGNMDLSGETTVTDPDTGEKVTASDKDIVAERMFGEGAPEPSPEAARSIELAIDKAEIKREDMSSDKVKDVAAGLGLIGVQNPLDFDPAGPYHSFAPDETKPVPAAAAAPGAVAPGSVGTTTAGPEQAARSGLMSSMAGDGSGITNLVDNPYSGMDTIAGWAGDAWNWASSERGYMTDYHSKRPGVDVSDPMSAMGEGKPSGVAGDQGAYLEEKRRKSQVIDRRLRQQAAEGRRLGL
jgi:hypothetical protein